MNNYSEYLLDYFMILFPINEKAPGNRINIQLYSIIIQKYKCNAQIKYPEKVMCKMHKKSLCVKCTKKSIHVYILCYAQYRETAHTERNSSTTHTYTQRESHTVAQHIQRERRIVTTHTHTHTE